MVQLGWAVRPAANFRRRAIRRLKPRIVFLAELTNFSQILPMRKSLLSAVGLTAALLCSAQGAIISGVTAISSSVTPTVEPLVEGTNVYHDRSPGHRLVGIPAELGPNPNVVVTSNSDKTLADFQLEVTTNVLGEIYIALDTRHAGSSPLAWMLDTGLTGLPAVFTDSGLTISIDEGSTFANAGDSIENTFNLWSVTAPAGTYNFYEQTFGGGSNNYVILGGVAIPEPSAGALGVLGFAGLLLRRRR